MSDNLIKKQQLRNFAAKQYGYFTAVQAQKIGYSVQSHTYQVKQGNWQKIGRGLFRLFGFDNTYEADLVRWTLWSRNKNDQPQGIISHKSALNHYNLIKPKDNFIHMTVPKGFRKSIPEKNLIIYKENLPLSDLESYGAFMTTNLFRTLKDTKEELELQGEWKEVAERVVNSGNLSENELLQLGIFSSNKNLLNLYNQKTLNEPYATINKYEKDELYYRAQDAKKIFESMEKQERWAMSASTLRANKSQQGGFTLVELLVVIAIISVLAGMLLPALENAITTAKFISCTSNLRQTGIATSSYGTDYEDYIPFAKHAVETNFSSYATPSAPAWYCLVGPYLGLDVYDFYRLGKTWSTGYPDGCVLTCPSQPEIFESTPCGYAPEITKGYNAPLVNNQQRGKLSQVKRPSTKSWLLEMQNSYNNWVCHNGNRWIWGDSWEYYTTFDRHNGVNINMLHFDGHVGSVEFEDIEYAGSKADCFYPYR